MANGKKGKRAESARPELRSGTGMNKLQFNAKDTGQMKRIEAVMKENGKPMPKDFRDKTASTNASDT